jgi:pectin methylesterase-like acyl-CoA thioesterase
MTLQNSARAGLIANSEIRTVATMVVGDKVAFYHCAFYSPHHTLFDSAGRHYYESCYIQGNIDFIFGNAQSMFQASTHAFTMTCTHKRLHGGSIIQAPKL